MFKARFSKANIRGAFCALLLPFALGGCFLNSGGGGKTDFGVTGKAKFGADSTIIIDRLELAVPAAAVTNPNGVNIQIQIVKQLPASMQSAGPRYTMLPGDTTFAAPITIRYHYAGLVLPEGTTENQLKLAKMGPTGLLTILPTALNVNDKIVSTTMSSFFTIALVVPAGAPPNNGAGQLLFLRNDVDGEADLWKASADGSGAALVLAHTPGEVLSSPRLSTVASRVAFTESSGGDPSFTKVYIAGLDGTNKTLVTIDGSIESVGDISINGDLLFVTHRDSDSALPDLAVYNISGAGPFTRTLLTNTGDEAELNPRISPDGTTLVFEDALGRLRRMAPVAGAKVKNVTSQRVESFSWSPDSQRLVVERPTNLIGGFAFGGGIGEITAFGTSTFFPQIKGSGGARRPSYSPNGQQFLFELNDSDPSVSAPTIRQLPKAGALNPILLGGAGTVFLGASPVTRP